MTVSRKVSIVMLTWNGLDYTKQCLKSLHDRTATPPAYELIVVDNGSTDGTVEYLEKQDWLTLIKNERNLGFVKGNNIGIAVTDSATDILLLNNDMVIIEDDWLAKLQEVAYSDSTYGIVGARLLMANGQLLHAGTYMPWHTFAGQQIGAMEKNVNQYNRAREVDGIVAACVYIKREVIEKVGVLDEEFFSYFEDTDYCLRVRDAGYKVILAGNVNLIHHENVSTKVNKTSFSRIYDKSKDIFRRKWGKYLKTRYDTAVMWHSLVNFPTGYATSSRHLVLELDRLNVDVRLTYLYGVDNMEPPSDNYKIEELKQRRKDLSLPQVVYGQGDAFVKNGGSYRIGYTMLEVTGLPNDWVNQANFMDEVWCPSTFNRETFARSGVTKPLYVMPLGVNPDYFNPQIKSFRATSRYTFLSVFEWGERKAPEILLRAYTEEFDANENVLLVLKVTNKDPGVNIQQQIKDMNLRENHAPIALMYNQKIPAYQMGSLYRSVDAFVLSTRGEGWGMPVIEAMACGIPTIATDWSAHADFMNEDNAYPLRVAKLIPAKAKCPYYEGFEWAEPDTEHLRYLMRYVYEHPDEARTQGMKASDEILANWTWRRAAEKIKARLMEIQG